jgi:Outer membrane receptor for ferrienterochelin and colicins
MRDRFRYLTLLFLLFNSYAFGQEETSEKLDPVVVTATKIPTPISQLGASIEIITEEEIKKRRGERRSLRFFGMLPGLT